VPNIYKWQQIVVNKDQLTNADLIEFKELLVGTGYGAIEPFRTIFGMSRSVYYKLTGTPEATLQPWYASQLKVYKALQFDVLVRVIKDAHGIDLREVRT
jgi:hypothetical protein